MKAKRQSAALKTALKKRTAAKKAGTYIGSKKLKSTLQKKGYSAKYAGAIVGTVARKKYGNKGAAALAAYGRKKK